MACHGLSDGQTDARDTAARSTLSVLETCQSEGALWVPGVMAKGLGHVFEAIKPEDADGQVP